jgi:NAD(P)H-dependent flavin oxidoreductase YrpB (nitropropane dioxygenase family)
MSTLEDQAGQALGAMLLAVVKSMTDAGMRPATAMRLAAFVAIDGSFGRGALTALGLPADTERRWRREVREAVAGVEMAEGPPLDFINAMLPMMGIEGVELHAKGPTK